MGVVKLLVFILGLHAVAIFFFTSGFLLTRTELPNVSACSDLEYSPCSMKNSSCWTNPGVNRVIILIIDALRFDFLAKSDNFPGEPKPWMDRLSVLQRLQEEQNAKIFKYIADPPTTTLQRLKGLTTGGLPTFIDVGHSFGAPAIVEDNLILQLAEHGKKVVMMGDDTWLQLFPKHFHKAYPFPSFNVKDLHTVDNGVISKIFPLLKQDNWDVLIGHFLGVDHVGHIFGVESPLMVEKLEQYNGVIEEIVSVLKSEARHNNTLLIVMGDHGQTLHGDHGGGTPEEVETGLFAMHMGNTKKQLSDADRTYISTLPQLDFAATLATLLGVPIPFGSVGRVNSDLYSVVYPLQNHESSSSWLEQYRDVLCINSWQVKRYLEHYTAAALQGIPATELSRLNSIYENNTRTSEDVKKQIAGYSTFLREAADMARSQWTQFSEVKMAIGLIMLILSIPVHAKALLRVYSASNRENLYEVFPTKYMLASFIVSAFVSAVVATTLYVLPSSLVTLFNPLSDNLGYVMLGAGAFGSILAYLTYDNRRNDKLKAYEQRWWSYAADSKTIVGIFFVLLHALSLLSNSFIMAEGHVASFLLATIGIIYLRSSLQSQSKILQAILFLVVNRVLSDMGLLSIVKDTMEADAIKNIPKAFNFDTVSYIGPLLIFVWFTVRYVYKNTHRINLCLVATLAIPLMYAAVALHWLISDLTDMKVVKLSDNIIEFSRLQLPRFVYMGTLTSTGIVYFSLSTHSFILDAVIALFGSWSASILLLLGRKAPLLELLAIVAVWCIMELQSLSSKRQDPVLAHWNFLALLIFFCTSHRCTFDGLRYPAAFIGFDDFNIYRQAPLLAIDTYGASHILPILGLPYLVLTRNEPDTNSKQSVQQIASAYLSFGLVRSITTVFSTLCVAIQRRHLMVWGLFAPKYVFDAIGLLFTDVLFVFAATLYFSFV